MLPKKGKVLPHATGRDGSEVDYPAAIAAALRRELGTSHQAIKSAMRWTGASERTVKNWLAGTSGPNGEHLIALARYSDGVLEVFLQEARRKPYVVAMQMIRAREKLVVVLNSIQDLVGDGETPDRKNDGFQE
jgi:hypothetical protein